MYNGRAEVLRCEIHAYCWITNHLHLLLRVSEELVFKVVRYFATQYARQFNRKYQSVGHVSVESMAVGLGRSLTAFGRALNRRREE